MGTSFGRGGATTFQQDLQHADCILIMGSNMAECHPVGFQWVMEAKERGAKVIHADPRFTRTSAVSDLHVPLRAGSDIAFLGGVVNHVLQGGHEFRDYVVNYTNAATIVDERFRDTEDLDGLFSGYDPDGGAYDPTTWAYEGAAASPAAGQRELKARDPQHPADGTPRTDPTLSDPRCVFQILKRHFSRYTPAMVAEVCGVPEDLFAQVCDALVGNSGRERTTAFCYAVGWTQHSVGVQYIRTAAILQLLLGNIGRPGGGILALRGHATIQGSTDVPTLFNLLPGYLPMPTPDTRSTQEYLRLNRSAGGYWGHLDAYLVSLLKAYFGDAATADNDWGFDWLPRSTGDHDSYTTLRMMCDDAVDGFFVMGENPVVGSAQGRLWCEGLSHLRWLVVRDFAEIETAAFWYDSPEVEVGKVRPEDIGTEVFLMPAAAHTEKDGSYTNTQRLLQWHHKAVEPPGDARSELWFMYHLGRRIREKLAASTDARDRPVLAVTWDYPMHGPLADPDADAVLAEVNGRDAEGHPLSGYTALKADGSTTCGCWIYCGCRADGQNQAARRRPASEQSWVAPEWGWAWPANRRLLYNRASADPDGRPWSERKAYVWWDEESGRWTGHDVPDFQPDKRPDYVPPEGATAEDAIAGTDPFIMQWDGKGWLYAPSGLVDGPLPTHYEPVESPLSNPLYGQQSNPARQVVDPTRSPTSGHGNPAYPCVLTTYRLTEHHTAGGMSRWIPYLSELQPEFFVEVSPALASDRGLVNGGWATIITPRSAVEARVLVTERLAPVRVGGRIVHQVGMPYHWGRKGLSTGDSANDLLHIELDPNEHIQESKALTCEIRAGRRPRGPGLDRLVAEQRARGAT